MSNCPEDIEENINNVLGRIKLDFEIAEDRFKIWQVLRDTPYNEWTEIEHEALAHLSNRQLI